MEFEYNGKITSSNSIVIDDVGDFALEAENENGYKYYMIARTLYGTTTIATCGPIMPDISLLPSGYCNYFMRTSYDEEKIYKQINQFLNGKKCAIIDAKLIDIDVAIDQFKDLGEYLRNYGDELY